MQDGNEQPKKSHRIMGHDASAANSVHQESPRINLGFSKLSNGVRSFSSSIRTCLSLTVV